MACHFRRVDGHSQSDELEASPVVEPCRAAVTHTRACGICVAVRVPPELVFLATAAAVIIAGARLAHDGGTIADRTGLGQGWVGAILVASATSLPEIATDVAAVRDGEPSLAIGDLFGSSMVNMLILGVADLLTRRTHLMMQVAVNQTTVGVLAMALTAVAAAGVLAGEGLGVLGVGWAPLTIGVGYVLGMRLIYVNRGSEGAGAGATRSRGDTSSAGLRRPVIGFVVAAAAILIVAPYLARSAAELAEQWGISSGFFGVVFLAAATSLPEAAVVGAAIKGGAYTLAVGNILGSNCFNMMVLLVLDVVDGAGSVLAQAEAGVVLGAVFAIVMMGQVLLDLLNRAEHRVWYIEPGPGLIVLTYAAGLFLTYRATH
jgi:cation:H+ antiporter